VRDPFSFRRTYQTFQGDHNCSEVSLFKNSLDPPPQSRRWMRRGIGRISKLIEALGDLNGHISQDIRITSQFIIIPAVNHGVGDGDFE